jgi:hypothetical protein
MDDSLKSIQLKDAVVEAQLQKTNAQHLLIFQHPSRETLLEVEST